MVLLGGLELVAAGYILKEIGKDSKAEEEERERQREREKRRRRRRHSRDDHDHHHHGRYEGSPPSRPSRPQYQQQQQQASQQLRPPPHPAGPPRPYSAPPPQNRPPLVTPSPSGWQPPQQPHPFSSQPQFHPPLQSQGTWPQQQPQLQQWQQPQRPQQIPVQRPNGNSNNVFVPQPPQPSATWYPPPGMHIDLKTGKVQTNMYPPEMLETQTSNQPQKRRDTADSRDQNRNDGRQQQWGHSISSTYTQPQHSYSQPQINVTPAAMAADQGRPSFSSPPPPQGFAELDAETPGRYRLYGHEKSRTKSNSFSGRHARDQYDYEHDLHDPPPAYRE
ncbi:hypothetical protein A1O3_05217 [Capronia epimyces CBS 606.96]|uniref:Uncharacterized protein n=1 Tax=Capronia epimyces CBS 606.96 TaxID=1182542 RepID=W9XWE5_9EURO|nr:uncharacterized protein A1O3_05217 [Capronia epimyces CBS 606.96]EXJ84548.1 hypothetical protein A1O3_05217 [Capronia epimyces CBS 606.96]